MQATLTTILVLILAVTACGQSVTVSGLAVLVVKPVPVQFAKRYPAEATAVTGAHELPDATV